MADECRHRRGRSRHGDRDGFDIGTRRFTVKPDDDQYGQVTVEADSVSTQYSGFRNHQRVAGSLHRQHRRESALAIASKCAA
jgi:hypothetical protein